MIIRKNIVGADKYSIKCPYTMKPEFIVVHNTANDATADAEIRYMKSNNRQVSFHYAVDDKEVVQGLEENRNGWHAGDGGKGQGNRKGIAIEICYSKSAGDRFIKAEQNAVKLIVDILKRYGWGVEQVKKHQDFSGKYCPHRTLDLGWERFIQMIKDELNPKPITTPIYLGYKGPSIVTYLNDIGVNSSFANRRLLAVKYGIVSKPYLYVGTANQNSRLLKEMRGF